MEFGRARLFLFQPQSLCDKNPINFRFLRSDEAFTPDAEWNTSPPFHPEY